MSTQIENQTIQEFLAKYPVKVTLVEVPENPTMDNSLNDMINYHVTLQHEDRAMSLYFSTGLGWVETLTGKSAQGVTYRKRDKLFLVRRGSTLYDANADRSVVSRYRIRKPTAADILDCLASDCSGIDNARGFEDWASDYGYDTDSRKALATYEQCVKQAAELQRLLGRDAYNELLNQTERM
jgi:hypothetical protein